VHEIRSNCLNRTPLIDDPEDKEGGKGKLAFALDKQNNAAHGKKGSRQGSIRDIVRGVFGSVDGSHVEDLIARLEPERTPDYDCDSDYDQNDCRCFH
jgi:hypothetical protein